jgi:hypothetical protein
MANLEGTRDPRALRQALQEALAASTELDDWCVACGATSAAGPELPRIVEQHFAKNPDLLTSLIHPDFIGPLAEKLGAPDVNANWCVACGASKGAAPELMRVLPASAETLTDAEIDTLAARLLRRTGSTGVGA